VSPLSLHFKTITLYNSPLTLVNSHLWNTNKLYFVLLPIIGYKMEGSIISYHNFCAVWHECSGFNCTAVHLTAVLDPDPCRT
jgi:hypothetical protein